MPHPKIHGKNLAAPKEVALPPPPFDDSPQDPRVDEVLPPPPTVPLEGQPGAHRQEQYAEEEQYAEGEEQYEEYDEEAEEQYEAYEETPLPVDQEGEACEAASGETGQQGEEQPNMQQEVAQLQDLVNSCLKSALKGCPCTFIKNGERTATRYFVDEALETLSIVSGHSPQRVEVAFAISRILDIFCVPEDGEVAFPPEVIASLTEEEKESVLLIVFQGRQRELNRFCLLMNSVLDRDSFMEAMRVLCVASRYNNNGSGKDQSSPSAPAPQRGSANGLDPLPKRSALQQPPVSSSQQVSVRFFMKSIGVKAMQNDTSSTPPLTPLIREGVVPYISAFGYKPMDGKSWQLGEGDRRPNARPGLWISVRQHIEAAKHTWYIVESTLRMEGDQRMQRIDWLAPRRLAHLRQFLYEPIKQAFGEAYSRRFEGIGFAHRMGPPGTTAVLHRWCSNLCECINCRTAPPAVVAITLNFLEAPEPWVSAPSSGQSSMTPSPHTTVLGLKQLVQ